MSNEVLEKVTASFEASLKEIKVKPKSYKEVNDFAIAVGEALEQALKEHVDADSVEFVSKILNDRLKANHRLIVSQGAKAQNSLNKQANIGLAVKKPKLNQDRIDGLVKRLIEEEFEDVKWLLGSPIVNFSQNVVDDMIRENADLHYKAGMRPRIIRKEEGKCCKWCKSLAGTYLYPIVPEDVYRRHENCRCTVEYIPKKGIKQDVHSKKIEYNFKDFK